MLTLCFTDRDLSRVRLAEAPDPLWEITNSLQLLQARHGGASFSRWGRQVRTALVGSGLAPAVRSLLFPVLPPAAYFPDFLTPAAAAGGLDAGIDAVLTTSRTRVLAELRELAGVCRLPEWAGRLADGELRAEFAGTLRAYHRQAVEPHREGIRAAFDRDRAVRARAVLDGGVEHLLDSFRPLMRWRPPVLEVDYPVTRTVDLAGRGLRLVPSYFCWRRPVALADPALPPVLVYPIARESRRPGRAGRSPAAALLGPTRAAVLRATRDGLNTGEIARIVEISAATASHHLTVLRESRLITSQRHASAMLHVLTPLGRDVLGSAS